ncbi:MAG: hypothetical protein ACREON_10705 [Gemmatimonadaceae bacterium]
MREAAEGTVDVIVTELDEERAPRVAPMVGALAGWAINVPIVLYMKKLNRPTVESLLAVLTPALRMHAVIREFDSLQSRARWILASAPPPCVSAVLLRHFVSDARPPLRPFLAAAALRASERHSVADLARLCGIYAGTVDRRLHRAGWASAHVVIRAFRAADVAWQMTQYGWSARRVQRERGFTDASAVTRLMSRYCGVTPSMIHEGASFRAVLAGVQRTVILKPTG